ncbi:MAG: hypothetical protein M1834_004689 [Cirrosporium novae-zelandiae]|nr:MAG: hypothetical protein M1834_004689 [Cirrosporium novae-zelandiae]
MILDKKSLPEPVPSRSRKNSTTRRSIQHVFGFLAFMVTFLYIALIITGRQNTEILMQVPDFHVQIEPTSQGITETTTDFNDSPKSHIIPSDLESFQQCSIKNFLGTGLPFLGSAAELPVVEYVQRRDRLAVALERDGVSAFVVEPGYTFKYYANVSQPKWEVWEPEERPFLMVVKPAKDLETGRTIANTSFLVPSFEAERARLLHMPFPEALQLVTWEEHWNPYTTLLDSHTFAPLLGRGQTPKIMVDEEMRDFIQRGLGKAGFDVVGLSGTVEAVRQRKSPREVEILRAVNTGTVEAVRQMRKCLYPGLTENDVMHVLDNTLRVAGMEPFFDIVLFEEDAALPHGGIDGTRVLKSDDYVLIDVGAHLYGYSSDICRTFFPPSFPKPTTKADVQALSPKLQEKLKVWDIVFEAQSRSIEAMKHNATAASADIAARHVIEEAGYRKEFTHRVGHGIGIKAHESPYLNKGNFESILKPGMAFTCEPGIYIDWYFGVRHEDILLVNEEGLPELLTGQRAIGPWDP